MDAHAAALGALRENVVALERTVAAQPEAVESVRADVRLVAKDLEQAQRSVSGVCVCVYVCLCTCVCVFVCVQEVAAVDWKQLLNSAHRPCSCLACHRLRYRAAGLQMWQPQPQAVYTHTHTLAQASTPPCLPLAPPWSSRPTNQAA